MKFNIFNKLKTKLPSINKFHFVIILLISISATFIGTFTYFILTDIKDKTNISNLSSLNIKKDKDILSLRNQINEITKEYYEFQKTDLNKKVVDLQTSLDTINNTYNNKSKVQLLIDKAKGLGINIDDFNKRMQNVNELLLAQKYTDAATQVDTLNTDINNSIDKKNNELAQQKINENNQKKSTQNIDGSSFTKTTVSALGRNFTVYYISIDLGMSGLKISTDTADNSDCANNCRATNLMNFYNNHHGFAAINGTYFCPISYSTCAGATNSFWFPVFNTNLNKWINEGNLILDQRAMMAFYGAHPTFYPDASKAPTSGMNAGIVMSPGLIHNGNIIVNNYPLDTKSSTVLALRGAIGIKGNTLIIADMTPATVPDSAYVMQSLGVTDALALDGGGSVAMIFNGQYVLGPGRDIPNAIIFSK